MKRTTIRAKMYHSFSFCTPGLSLPMHRKRDRYCEPARVFFPERYRPKAEKPPLLFGDYVKTWETTLVTRGLKLSIINAYHQRLQKRILPAFGTTPLIAFDRPAIKQWAAALLEELLDSGSA
jgi:hypothetical protein